MQLPDQPETDQDPAHRDPGDQDASVAYDEAKAGGYTIITQWRLNSGNFEYEQDQQKRLYKLANGAGRTQ